MALEAAKSEFDTLVNKLPASERQTFFTWLSEVYIPAAESDPEDEKTIEGRINLQKIANELRGLIPFEGILESEKLAPPTVGEDKCLTRENTIHLDAFLYGPDEEERLVDEGKLSKSICSDCGSKNIEDVTILTHSCSHERIEYMFRGFLPSLKDLRVLDIGSRLGAVLYGSFYHSEAAKIVGVEINPELCSISEKIVKKFRLSSRVQIVNDNILNVPDTIKSSNVIILNNVFEWFQSVEEQVKIWRYLKDTISPGTLLVTIPSLETSLEPLNTGISLEDWISEEEPSNPDFHTDEVEITEMFLYRVK